MSLTSISQILHRASQRLALVSGSVRLDAEVLVAHALNLSRTQLYIHSDRKLTAEEEADIDAFVARRFQGEPIAYIVGSKEFWSLSFKVTQATLIPRPETEHLVELALSIIPEDASWCIADLGTGSGAIAISVAKERQASQIFAVDKSSIALGVARENAFALDAKNVQFIQSDWFSELGNRTFNLIISNPPYIARQDEHLNQGDLVFEPKSALVSGDDGLHDIRRIVENAKNHLIAGGALLLEHGWDQSEAVRAILEEFSYSSIQTHQDLSGCERITTGLVE